MVLSVYPRAFEDPDFRRIFFGVFILIIISIGLGLLFRGALDPFCIARLGIVLLSSTFFWTLTGPFVFELTHCFHSKDQALWVMVGSGFLVVVANQILVYTTIQWAMATFYGCISLQNSWLFSGITNNALINSLCFVGFIFAGKKYAMKRDSTKQGGVPEVDILEIRGEPQSHISVKYGTVVSLVPVKKIFLIEADHNCISLFSENSKHVLYQSLKSIEQVLPGNFVRVHRSYIVNKDFVIQLESLPTGDAILILSNQRKVRMSRTYKKNYLSA